MFSVFVNDLISEVNDMHLGVNLGDENISILLYADDIALVAENEANYNLCLINFMIGVRNGAF